MYVNKNICFLLHFKVPGVYKPWVFNCPRNYWNCDTGIIATRWLIEEKLQWNDDEVRQKLDKDIFTTNGLAGMLQQLFGGYPFKAINALYPGKYYPWELKKTANNYWTKENGIKATKWLINEKLKIRNLTIDMLGTSIKVEDFHKNGLASMILYVYEGSYINAIKHYLDEVG